MYLLFRHIELRFVPFFSACTLYHFNRPAFDNLAREAGWAEFAMLVSFLHTTYDYFVDVSARKSRRIELEEEDEDKRVVSYSLSTGETTTSGTIPPIL